MFNYAVILKYVIYVIIALSALGLLFCFKCCGFVCLEPFSSLQHTFLCLVFVESPTMIELLQPLRHSLGYFPFFPEAPSTRLKLEAIRWGFVNVQYLELILIPALVITLFSIIWLFALARNSYNRRRNFRNKEDLQRYQIRRKQIVEFKIQYWVERPMTAIVGCTFYMVTLGLEACYQRSSGVEVTFPVAVNNLFGFIALSMTIYGMPKLFISKFGIYTLYRKFYFGTMIAVFWVFTLLP